MSTLNGISTSPVPETSGFSQAFNTLTLFSVSLVSPNHAQSMLTLETLRMSIPPLPRGSDVTLGQCVSLLRAAPSPSK